MRSRRFIHLTGALTWGLSSFIIWRAERRRDRPTAKDALDSFLWNASLFMIMIVYDMICLAAIVAIAMTGVFHEHTTLVIIIIGVHDPLLFVSVNLCFAAVASSASREHVEYPYPLPPISLQRKLRRLLGEEDKGGAKTGTDSESTS